MEKPILKECFADNGEHSHWELRSSENGELIWSEESPKESLLEEIEHRSHPAHRFEAMDEKVILSWELQALLRKYRIFDSKKEYLLCAAIRRVEERECPKVYWEQFHDIYKIELGWRHPDIMHRFGKEVSRNPNDQGFYTSKGRFVTREEGLEIARAAGQVDKIIGGVLTSEDLY